MLDQIEALIHQISEDDHEEEEWHEILTGEDWKYQNKVNVTECHVIDYIGKNRLTNAVGIATALNMTKGSISKITTRLLEKGFIESHRMEGNRKELFFTLTRSGGEVYKLHEKLHEQARNKLDAAISTFTQEELIVIHRFIHILRDTI
ncbi:MarR family transcriptional regulator [Paenibacillus macerans]|nr:MarR family transcriptional regulator [Paenibacillus macerans]GBK72298.1 MarR family transcriptional regulator [Paenibacillus macerans]GIP12475.1 MarR family transcriptional regulator [Paenibacillus macerans]